MDQNQAEVVAGLRGAGVWCQVLSGVGSGVPDLLVWSPWTRAFHLLEVKAPGHATDLTPDERMWIAACKGPVEIVCDVGSALRAVGVRATGL